MREVFQLGGVAVRPGGRETIDLPITDLSTHMPITMPVHVIHGRRPGPRLFVCAALHGDEICGVEIIRRLIHMRGLNGLRGTLVAIPVVNVLGFIALSRYLPDRRDLNRSFPGTPKGSLAGRIAHMFCNEIVAACTHGIDIHTGAVHRANFPQIRANLDNPEALRLAQAFGVPVIINAGYREGSLRMAAANHDVPVLVYEAGEALRFDELVIRAGVKGITHVMRTLGMLPPSKRRRRIVEPVLVRSSTWVRAPLSGVLRTVAPLGGGVKRGQVLGIISDPFGMSETEVPATADGIVVGRTNLPLVHEGDGLFHIVRVEGTKAAAEALDAFDPGIEYDQGMTKELAADAPIV